MPSRKLDGFCEPNQPVRKRVPDSPTLERGVVDPPADKTTVALEARSDNHDRFVLKIQFLPNETRDSKSVYPQRLRASEIQYKKEESS